jgi:hypothetical protein
LTFKRNARKLLINMNDSTLLSIISPWIKELSLSGYCISLPILLSMSITIINGLC